MEDKELEKLIKESADKIQMQPFEERWNAIEGRLQKNEEKKGVNFKLVRWVSLAASFCLVLALAIILPLVLKPALDPTPEPPPVSYFGEKEVNMTEVAQADFYSDLAQTEMQTISFSNLEIEEYYIGKTSDDVVKGGRVLDETGTAGYFLKITFYDNTVTLKEEDYKALTSIMTVNGVEVKYNTTEDGLFTSNALLTYKDVTYIVVYTSANDDLSTFLSGIFQ